MRYQKFDPALMARRSYNYLTRMVDEKEDNLPYWLILPNKKPAEAAHCRVDDAELVGSWYEGLDSAVSMLSSLFGVAVIALPSGVITASYLEELRSARATTTDASTTVDKTL